MPQGTEISEPYFGDQTTWIKGVADKAKNLAKRRLNTNDATMPVTEAISMTNGAVFWRMLLTSLKDGHYSYKGSLTTPGRPHGVLIHWQNSYSKAEFKYAQCIKIFLMFAAPPMGSKI